MQHLVPAQIAAPKPHVAIANEIARHIGGTSRLSTFVGANGFLAHGPSDSGYAALSFKLPTDLATKDGVNYIKITLTRDDLYLMELGRITMNNPHPSDYTVVKTIDGLYDGMLITTFETETGLFLHL